MNNKRKQVYSEEFKKEKVKLLESGEVRLSDLKKMYGVSYTSLYQWKQKYGRLSPSDCVVLEKGSEYKKNHELRDQIVKMERLLGRQQMQLDYYKELVTLLNSHLGIDVEKKFLGK